MNAAIRRTLQTLLEGIDQGPLETLKSELETIRDDEQEKLDAIPEQLAEGRSATELQEGIEALDSAIDELATILQGLETVQDSITTAQGQGPVAPKPLELHTIPAVQP